MTAKQVTFKVLDRMCKGEEFSGIRLADTVEIHTHKKHYPATTLRYMREYRALSGRYIECISKPRSLYKIS